MVCRQGEALKLREHSAEEEEKYSRLLKAAFHLSVPFFGLSSRDNNYHNDHYIGPLTFLLIPLWLLCDCLLVLHSISSGVTSGNFPTAADKTAPSGRTFS